jgi:predicted kinase
VTRLPTLVVVGGPPGAGKTTLAHAIARAVGCPAICRDEIKEGMVHATPGFVAGPGDELSRRTLPAFFGVLNLLLSAGVTVVAEAAFQDRLWRPGLEPLRGLARIRIVHCTVAADVAVARRRRRWEADPRRRAHENTRPADTAARVERHNAFDRVSVDAPWIEVDTTDGYAPGLDEIVAFANS